MKRPRTGSILLSAIAAMEIGWLGAGLDLLNRKIGGGSLSVPSLLAFYPLGFLGCRVMRGFSFPRALGVGGLGWAALVLLFSKKQFYGRMEWTGGEWLGALMGALGRMFHSLNPESLAVLGSAILWGLGWRLAATRIHFSALVAEFQFGLALLLVFFLLDSLWGTNSALLVPLSLAFFFAALAGLAVSHAQERQSWIAGPARVGWLGFLFSSIALILGAGWAVSRVIDPPLMEFLMSLLARLGQGILEILREIFLFLVSLIPPPKPGQLPSSPPVPQMSKPDEFPFQIFSETVREVIRFIWLLVWAFIIVLALWRVSSQLLDWLRRRWAMTVGLEVEPLPGAFREDLARILKGLLRALGLARLWRRRQQAEPILPEAEKVRRLYRQLLRWAALRGQARNPDQTPYEFLRKLMAWLPEQGEDFALITEKYVAARFSPQAPTGGEVEELRRRWGRVRRTRVRGRKKKNPGSGPGAGPPGEDIKSEPVL